MRSQGLVPPMRRCRETTTSCRNTVSCKTAEPGPGSIARGDEISRVPSRLHGKLVGSGELQVNSIVPPLTFGLFALHLTLPCTMSLTYSTLLLLLFCISLAFTLHFSDARSVCMAGHMAHVHQAQARIKN